jgi:small subunit ribosomal protein S17
VETVQNADRGRQTLQGIVVSDKMDKTIVVEITMRMLHPLYKKYVTRSKRIKAHDEKNEAHEGDTVRVVETRPLSRDKRWRLAEVVEKAK